MVDKQAKFMIARQKATQLARAFFIIHKIYSSVTAFKDSLGF